MKKTKFRNVYVLQPTHNFTPLARYAESIRFLTGKEEADSLSSYQAMIAENLSEFDPDLDAIVIVGKVNLAFLFGVTIHKLMPGASVTLGIYIENSEGEKDYNWEKINI